MKRHWYRPGAHPAEEVIYWCLISVSLFVGTISTFEWRWTGIAASLYVLWNADDMAKRWMKG